MFIYSRSHKSPVENLKWLPKNVWFSQESAFPKVNQDEDNRQFITCAAEMYVLVWDFLRPDMSMSILHNIFHFFLIFQRPSMNDSFRLSRIE